MPVVGDLQKKSPVPSDGDANNMAVSVKLSARRQYRGKSAAAMRRPRRDSTPCSPVPGDEDIVRSPQRWGEGDRNDLPALCVHNKPFFINPATPYQYNTAGSSGPEGAASSSIYLLQVPELEMVDLMPIGRTELAKRIWSSKTLLYRWSLHIWKRIHGNTEGTSHHRGDSVETNTRGQRTAARYSPNLWETIRSKQKCLAPGIASVTLLKIADSVRFFISEYTVLAVSLLRLVVVRLHETIRYIGEGLLRTLRGAAGEIIPREVGSAILAFQPRREHMRIAL